MFYPKVFKYFPVTIAKIDTCKHDTKNRFDRKD